MRFLIAICSQIQYVALIKNVVPESDISVRASEFVYTPKNTYSIVGVCKPVNRLPAISRTRVVLYAGNQASAKSVSPRPQLRL